VDCINRHTLLTVDCVNRHTLLTVDCINRHTLLTVDCVTVILQSFSHLSQYHVHLFKTIHTVGFTDTHLSTSVNLCYKMLYDHQTPSYFTQVTHAAKTIAYALSH